MLPPFADDRLKSERASEKDGYGRLWIPDLPLTQTNHPTAVRPEPTFTNLTVVVSNAPLTYRSAPNRGERQFPVPTISQPPPLRSNSSPKRFNGNF